MVLKLTTFVVAVFIFACDCEARFQGKDDFQNFSDVKNSLEAGKIAEVRAQLKTDFAGVSNTVRQYLYGLTYFYEGDYENALRSVDYSAGIPDIAGEEYFLRLMPVVHGISAKFERFTYPTIELRAYGKDIILKEGARLAALAALKSLEENLGYTETGGLLLEIFPDQKTFAVCSTLGDEVLEHSGAVGICKFNRTMIISPKNLPFGYRWKDTIVHEITHLVINRLSGTYCPLWLHEGIARYFDTAWRVDVKKGGYLTASQKSQLVSALENNKLIPFEKMHPSLVYLDSQQDMNLAFSQAASVVDFMITTFGGAVIPKLLNELKESKGGLEKSLVKASGYGFGTLIEMWREYLGGMKAEAGQGQIQDIYLFSADKDEVDLFVEGEARDYVRLGDMFYAKGNYELAVSHYNDALGKQPKNPVVLRKCAKAYLVEGNYENAVEKLKISITQNPNYCAAFVLLGDLYFETGESAASLHYYNESLDINPFDYNVIKRVALIEMESGNTVKAREELLKCALLDPGDTEVKEMLDEVRVK